MPCFTRASQKLLYKKVLASKLILLPGGTLLECFCPYEIIFFFLFLFLALGQGPLSAAASPTCTLALNDLPHLLVEEDELINEIKKPLMDGQIGVRLLTDEATETPDPERPVKVTLPDGRQKYLVGLSGQNIILVDNLAQLAGKVLISKQKIKLFNAQGYPFGGEKDAATGQDIGYSHDSSTWDISVVPIRTPDGQTRLKILAGAMADGADGKPLMIEGNHSRSRLFFDAEFIPLSPLTRWL